MKFSIIGTFARGQGDPIALAREAEALGYESLWTGDHLVPPLKPPSTYPYSATGEPPFTGETPWLDPFVLLGSLASVTSRIKLGTSVYILPLRSLFVTARAVTTLDVLSKGRALFGVGIGWLKDEFETERIDFKTRAARTDEIIHALRLLWTQPVAEYRGRHISFGPAAFNPKPTQPIPIHVGGESEAALRRAARIGDGWIGVGYDPVETERRIRTLQRWLKDEGRDSANFEVTVQCVPPLTRETMLRYQDWGVHRLKVRPWSRPEHAMDGIKRFAHEVMAKL